ncbi:MAG: hypothetical protein H6698_01635 [Myxococcales bacterium]|nr:hypothetical protein [Myxococcales bacterium]MCB9531102.1 hypothetical protein [Myxococcales bacterium]MCB9533012.1 hypothetical protein [Myxococcales bacterium]
MRADEHLDALPHPVRVELESLFDPRYLIHRGAELERILKVRSALDARPPLRAVEIGSNTGAFLAGVGRDPSTTTLGIEWRAKNVVAAEERIARRGLSGAMMLQADARLALSVLVPERSLDAVYVLFPDPWWKTRHAERRVLDVRFLRTIARRLRDGGALYLKSDVFDYLYRVRSLAEASRALRPLPAARWPDERDWAPSTRERKCMSTAIPFGRGYYERHPAFDTTLPTEPERESDFVGAELPVVDAESIIRGPAPYDREALARGRARRRE